MYRVIQKWPTVRRVHRFFRGSVRSFLRVRSTALTAVAHINTHIKETSKIPSIVVWMSSFLYFSCCQHCRAMQRPVRLPSAVGFLRAYNKHLSLSPHLVLIPFHATSTPTWRP